jgi:hypothetical protein
MPSIFPGEEVDAAVVEARIAGRRNGRGKTLAESRIADVLRTAAALAERRERARMVRGQRLMQHR